MEKSCIRPRVKTPGFATRAWSKLFGVWGTPIAADLADVSSYPAADYSSCCLEHPCLKLLYSATNARRECHGRFEALGLSLAMKRPRVHRGRCLRQALSAPAACLLRGTVAMHVFFHCMTVGATRRAAPADWVPSSSYVTYHRHLFMAGNFFLLLCVCGIRIIARSRREHCTAVHIHMHLDGLILYIAVYAASR